LGREGKPNPQIAADLSSTEPMIKNQLRGIFDKLGVWSRLELALHVASHGGAKWAESTNLEAAHAPAIASAAAVAARTA